MPIWNLSRSKETACQYNSTYKDRAICRNTSLVFLAHISTTVLPCNLVPRVAVLPVFLLQKLTLGWNGLLSPMSVHGRYKISSLMIDTSPIHWCWQFSLCWNYIFLILVLYIFSITLNFFEHLPYCCVQLFHPFLKILAFPSIYFGATLSRRIYHFFR